MSKDARLNLATRIKAHAADRCTFANSVFSTFGIASVPGRYCDRYVNAPATWVYALNPGNDLEIPEAPPPSPAAAAMIAAAVRRPARWRVALTATTKAAMLGYLAERTTLLTEAAPLVAPGSQLLPKLRRALIAAKSIAEAVEAAPAA